MHLRVLCVSVVNEVLELHLESGDWPKFMGLFVRSIRIWIVP